MNQAENTIVDKKQKLLNDAWLWFTRLNIISILVIMYLLYSWIKNDPILGNANMYFQLAIILAAAAILFISHFTLIFPITLGFILLVSQLLKLGSGGIDPQIITITIIELVISLITAPLVYFHIRYFGSQENGKENDHLADKNTDQLTESVNIRNDGEEKQKNMTIDDLLAGITIIEMIFLSIVGGVLGIVFYFTFLSILQPISNGMGETLRLLITIGLAIGVMLGVTIPLTMAARYVPEAILRKILLKELPFDLVILLGGFQFFGMVLFLASLMGSLYEFTEKASLFDLMSENWVLILILTWGILFYGGVIVAWIKQFFAPASSLVDVKMIELTAIFPLIVGLYILGTLFS